MKRLTSSLRRRVESAPAIAVLLASFVILFRDALFRGQYLLVGDPLRQLYPIRTVAWNMIRSGTPPLWTPHLLSGYPLSAMVMLGITYPLTWGYAFLPGWWAEQLYILAPYVLAPLFTFAFLRELGRGASASILGALTFGFGGFLFSTIGLTGVHANSALWIPLLLLAVARARRTQFVPSLLLGTFAFAMSVVAGSGQIFLYGGSVAVAFGVFLGVFPEEEEHSRWRPAAVGLGSIVLGVGLTAYQVLETWVATSLSVRRAYPAERFSEGSFKPEFAWHALVQPLGNFWDSSTFVPLLSLLLGIVAVIAAGTRRRGSSQTFFWAFVAVIAWLLILGNHTPLFSLYSEIPFAGRFRYPSRHSLEWSLAIGVLAARGWDVAIAWLLGPRRHVSTATRLIFALACLALAAWLAVRWSAHDVARDLERIGDINLTANGIDGGYVAYKLAFTAAAIAALAACTRLPVPWLRRTLIAAALVICCLIEPFFWLVRPVIRTSTIPRAQFHAVSRTSRIIQRELGPHPRRYLERVYSAAHPYAVGFPGRQIEAANWTALEGFHEANGYESLISERYSMAMRGGVDGEPFIYPDHRLLDPRSRVLDLLNVRYVTAYDEFDSAAGPRFVKDGVAFTPWDLATDVPPDRDVELVARGFTADQLVLVTSMSNSADVEEGEPVARAVVQFEGGERAAIDVRAGRDTSEWAHDRADVRAVVRHRRARLFDSSPAEGFEAHRYFARIPIGRRGAIEKIEIRRSSREASVGLWKASLADSVTGSSRTLPQPSFDLWRTVAEENGVTVMENRDACPRAWLVGSVTVVDDAESLRRIRGESNAPFDPMETALVASSAGLPRLSGELATSSFARISKYEPNQIEIETSSDRPAFLVVSELEYPGWIATVDGVATPITRADYLLRGLPVPAGRHTVEMRYTAPAMKRGAVVSLATLLLLAFMTWRSRRA